MASTKAFTGQVTVMAMLALAVGREKGTVTEEYYREVAKGLLELPAVLEDVLGLGDRIADLSKIFTYAHNFIYLGRGYNYPTALEGALKLKEISYIHAEGYPAAEMKHGAIALQQGPQRRPAAQPGQVGDGGITSRRGLPEKSCLDGCANRPAREIQPTETPAVKEVCGGFSTHNYH